MPSFRKRAAEEAFVEHESVMQKSKRRRHKNRSKLRLEDEEMVDSPARTPPAQVSLKEESVQTRALRPDIESSPQVAPKTEHTEEAVARLDKGERKKRREAKKIKQNRDLVKSDSNHIGAYAVVKRDTKKSPKKSKTKSWSLSQAIGGIFIDQDPILVDRDQYLILPTAGGIQIYSTKTSLLVRTLHISEDDPVTSCVLDADDSSHIFLSRLSGMVQLWDWMTGQRQEQWKFQADLLEIVTVVTESPAQYKVLTIHGTSDGESKLIQSFATKSTTMPHAEVVLLTKRWRVSRCKSVDEGHVLLFSFGQQLVIGQLLPVSKASNEKTYTWREVRVPQPIESMDIRTRQRPKIAGSSPVKMIDVVIGCTDGVILMYEDLLYRLIGRERGIKDIEILSRRMHWHRQGVNTVKWSRDGNYLVSGGNETVLVIWQLDTNQQQFLPHLSSPILNLTISGAGSSYVLRLADNSVMVLSTADLLPSANISGLALMDDPSHPALAALSTRDLGQLLLAIHPDPLSNDTSSTTMLQTFDTRTARQASRQALVRNLTTELRVAPDGGKVHEPNVSHLKTSHDGTWLVTIDEWRPKPHDLDALHSEDHGCAERLSSIETHLRFWKWQEEGSTWELVTRVDEPHSSGKKSVLALAMHPLKLEASTIGLDGMLRKWSPMARYRDGVAVKAKSGQALYTWVCSKAVRLEPEQPTLVTVKETSATMTYSEDGSVLAASWCWSDVTSRVVHIVNARTTEPKLAQAHILSAGPAQLAFSGRYLLALSDNFCIWDTVALKKAYSMTLRHTSRDGKFLAANPNDGTFALAFDLRQPVELSSVAVFSSMEPYKGPLHQGKIYGHVRVLLPHAKSSGYLIVDSNARIRHLTPPGAVRSAGSMAVATAEDAAKGLKDIFGDRSAITNKPEDATGPAGQLTLPSAESNAEQRSLDGVLNSITFSRLPSVRQMFEQVAGLFARKSNAVP